MPLGNLAPCLGPEQEAGAGATLLHALEHEMPAATECKPMCDGQPEARPGTLAKVAAAEERFSGMFQRRRIHARSGVLDLQSI